MDTDGYGYPCKSMDIMDVLDIHGDPWISMDIYGCPKASTMVAHGTNECHAPKMSMALANPMDTWVRIPHFHGNPWRSIEFN